MSVIIVTGNVYFKCKYHSEQLTDAYVESIINQADHDRITLSMEKLDVIPDWLAQNDDERFLFKYAFRAEIDETYHGILGGYKGDPEVKQFLKERFVYYNRNQAFYYSYMDEFDMEMEEKNWTSEISQEMGSLLSTNTGRQVRTISLNDYGDIDEAEPNEDLENDWDTMDDDIDDWEIWNNAGVNEDIDDAIDRANRALTTPAKPVTPRKKTAAKKPTKRAVTPLEPKKKEYDEKLGAKRKIFVIKDDVE